MPSSATTRRIASAASARSQVRLPVPRCSGFGVDAAPPTGVVSGFGLQTSGTAMRKVLALVTLAAALIVGQATAGAGGGPPQAVSLPRYRGPPHRGGASGTPPEHPPPPAP